MTPSADELMESHLDEYVVHSTKFLGCKIERISHPSSNSSGYDGEGNANEFRALGCAKPLVLCRSPIFWLFSLIEIDDMSSTICASKSKTYCMLPCTSCECQEKYNMCDKGCYAEESRMGIQEGLMRET